MNNGKAITAGELKGVLIWTVVFAILFYFTIRFIEAVIIILLIFMVIMLITIILLPVVNWAERYKVPRGLTAALLAIAGIAIVAVLIYLSAPVVLREGREMLTRIPEYLHKLKSYIAARLPGLAHMVPTSFGSVAGYATHAVGGILGYAVGFVEAIVALIVIVIGSIYMLTNPEPIVEGLVSLFPQREHDRVVHVMQRVNDQMRAWAFGTAIAMVTIFIMTYITLTLIHIEPILLFSLLAGFLELMPTVGPLLSAIPPLFAALATNPTKAIYVVIAYIIIHQFENHVIVPLVQANRLRLHPITIIFAILIMAVLFGIIGIFLAAPTAAVVKILYDELYLKPRRRDREAMREKADEIVEEDETEDE